MQPAVDAPDRRTIRRHFSSADRESGRYQYVPFDVAPGTESLTIAYRYDSKDGASVVDLGLFEPGPLTLGSAAFRGYSGGAQQAITVGGRTASPGYRAGGLPPGTWHVLLGLYKVAADGVDVEIEVAAHRTADAGDVAADAPDDRPAARPGSASGRWYVGGLHLHTTHSDGSAGPATVSDLARSAGLDFIAITDHNNTFHAREPVPSFPLHIIGEEVTTPAGHANVWGLEAGSFVDFRVTPGERGAADAINGLVAQAHGAGALFSINHPAGDCGGCAWQQVVPDALDAIEIWNGEAGPQEQAVALWDRLLRSGRRVTAVGASDWHRAPARIDAAAVQVLARELSESAILDGIRRGRVSIVRNAAAQAPRLAARCRSGSAGIGDTLTCAAGEAIAVSIDAPGAAGGRVDVVWDGVTRESRSAGGDVSVTLPAAAGYLRVTVRAADGAVLAMTNPIYVATR